MPAAQKSQIAHSHGGVSSRQAVSGLLGASSGVRGAGSRVWAARRAQAAGCRQILRASASSQSGAGGGFSCFNPAALRTQGCLRGRSPPCKLEPADPGSAPGRWSGRSSSLPGRSSFPGGPSPCIIRRGRPAGSSHSRRAAPLGLRPRREGGGWEEREEGTRRTRTGARASRSPVRWMLPRCSACAAAAPAKRRGGCVWGPIPVPPRPH